MALPHDPRPRTGPAMPSSHPLPPSCHWFSRLASALDPRSGPRLAWLLVGAVLARGRRTVTSWIRAAGLSDAARLAVADVNSELADQRRAGDLGLELVGRAGLDEAATAARARI